MARATNITTISPINDALMLSSLRSSLELTDACIIDSDPDFVTFAVKVPRAVLTANRHFLRVALEAADNWRERPAVGHGKSNRRSRFNGSAK
jgi:hypothetical protein